jgi:hypothetical protein
MYIPALYSQGFELWFIVELMHTALCCYRGRGKSILGFAIGI